MQSVIIIANHYNFRTIFFQYFTLIFKLTNEFLTYSQIIANVLID